MRKILYFGSELQNVRIATDKSDVYVGVYSLENLRRLENKKCMNIGQMCLQTRRLRNTTT